MPDEIGTPAEGAASTTAPAETSTPSVDFGPVLSRVDELANGLTSRLDAFEQRIPAPQTPAEPDPWADIFGPEQPQEGFDQFGQAAQPQQPPFDPQALQNAINQAIQQQNAPLQQQLAQFQLQRDTEQLYTEIPDLRPLDPTHADFQQNLATRQQTAQLVQASVSHLPAQMQQALINDPKHIALVFKAAEAAKLANGQTPATSEVPTLEAAGGATPAGDGPQNIAQTIYANRGAAMPSGFGR